MINDICNFTKNKLNYDHILNYNELMKLDLSYFNYNNYIEDRQSFRNFKSSSHVPFDKIKVLIRNLQDIKNKIFFYPNNVKIGFIDNKNIISKNNFSHIYLFENNQFKNIEVSKKIDKENLFIQSEMHDADGVLFFLWDINKFNNILENPNFIYKEILMASGLLGQLSSIIAINNNLKGTPFAGIIQPEWKSLTNYYKDYRPIFAYAFTSNF